VQKKKRTHHRETNIQLGTAFERGLGSVKKLIYFLTARTVSRDKSWMRITRRIRNSEFFANNPRATLYTNEYDYSAPNNKHRRAQLHEPYIRNTVRVFRYSRDCLGRR
jgi:protein subunit release factor B